MPADKPTKEDLYERMEIGTPYSASEFVDEFPVTRWTIHNWLVELHEEGRIERKKHSETRVTWWRSEDGGG